MNRCFAKLNSGVWRSVLYSSYFWELYRRYAYVACTDWLLLCHVFKNGVYGTPAVCKANPKMIRHVKGIQPERLLTTLLKAAIGIDLSICVLLLLLQIGCTKLSKTNCYKTGVWTRLIALFWRRRWFKHYSWKVKVQSFKIDNSNVWEKRVYENLTWANADIHVQLYKAT